MHDVIVKNALKSMLPMAFVLALGLAFALPAHALRLGFARSGDSDAVTFVFESGQIPSSTITRTGSTEITIPLPSNIWFNETRPTSSTYAGTLIQQVEILDGAVKITTRSSSFGFVRIPDAEKPEFVLQIFRDPYGSRWKPPTAQTAAPAQKQAAAPAPQPAPAATPVIAPAVKPTPAPQAEAPQQATPAPAAQEATPATPNAATPPAAGNDDQRPFFATPYAVRNQVTPQEGATDAGTNGTDNQPQAAEDPIPVSGAGRAVGKVTPPTRRRVIQPEPPTQAQPAPQTEPMPGQTAAADTPAPASNDLGADLVQTDEERLAAQAQAAKGLEDFFPKEVTSADQAAQFAHRFQVVRKNADDVLRADMARRVMNGSAPNPTLAEPAQAQEDGAAQPADAPAATAAAPAEQAPTQTQAQRPPVRQRIKLRPPDQTGPDGMPMVIEGAPPPAPEPGDENVVPDPTLAAKQPTAQTTEAAQAPAETAPPAPETAETTAAPEAVSEASAEAEAHRQQLEELLRQAQSMMFQGDFKAALPLLEMLLREPGVDQNIREEALYAVADIKKEMYSDSMADHFDEVRTAYEQAMNLNLKSERIPSALVSLGLINLKVGNFPEARAYFNLLSEKFPDDQNVPAISYYWGKYYYDKGEFAKAADQFQYLIQSYPEHSLVKQAAFYLADSLNRLDFFKQAYQIVDYMDKRWPDYHMENKEFLRLAGDVEQHLDMLDAAKDHYLTYYNLDPESQGADVVLTHVGDIYLGRKLTGPAKNIYDKVIKDFPDGEGSLVAKMRLAEEGVYDNPSFVQMASVFDRPYNLQPRDIYKEIVEKHPASPLAPVAQLKLAMWYTFHEQFPDALASAQDLIEKFPDSPLVEKARELGDKIFVQAVPGLMQDERYDRVIRYWEGYDFIGKKNTKVDDNTRLNVATSYWKIGQPAKALALIQPFLDAPTKTELSENALSLAVNVYLDQLAWQEIADIVADAKKKWQLSDRIKRQMDYARAMSLQNMGETKQALVMWADLAKDVDVDPTFRAYAMYYMAHSAREKKDLRKLFVYSQEALALLLQTNGDPEKIKDMVLLSIYATEQSGRYREALKWAREYDKYVTVDNPDWATTRFKLASIYRKAGATDEWRALLQDIIDRKPDTLQAQLAQSSLDTYALEQKALEYVPR